ncbi:type III restriction enzyme [Polaromonas sp. OV174]|uniref:DEAD/DEAH box helicase n=1 Tax=Polaromonas sp. OV174 TaxID=1855300 RepID=UPI0008F08504|nr:DEAD/DEAH box helicase family protein [Polaromonas sp. OV174]SFC11258.1 type III restriction enzyme [Polaromonas sp. OV174]
MSKEKIVRTVAGRLSLREPQTVSLERLHFALESVPALRDSKARSVEELKAMQEALKAEFPKLTDFERDFPSLCFALATGVGKTRLMGAFISYLHAAYGYKHFFVLAPNLTIYDKLIRDFSDTTGPKYVFKGIADFAVEAPEVITGETYDQKGDLVSQAIDAPVQINIFNISKINSEVRGGKAPKIKRLSEYLGQSYFEYLAGLPDLVLIMDESHRYRAGAGIRALNELKPLLGLELTATPFTEGTKGPVPFKNVVMDYTLARAIEDGFVKEPAVVTQQNFNPADHSAEQLERIKLMDGIRVHEETKVHLLTYSEQTGQKPVKPFMLVIARDTTHAAALLGTIEGLFDGQYKGKVIQVDSSKSGAEEEEMIRRLLLVESYTEPTEVVIHVNMLKEGWDVTNLYTIVPLRAANARTLIEQSIGRGLRLPYGRKTGVEVVDRLNIIAHDRFKEVIDEAGKGDSPIRLKELKLEPTDSNGSRFTSISVPSNTSVMLGISGVKGSGADGAAVVSAGYGQGTGGSAHLTSVVFTGEERRIALVTMDAVAELGKDRILVPTSTALGTASVQEKLTQLVMERLVPQQGELLDTMASNAEAVAEVVKKSVEVFIDQTIDIPRITVVPIGPVKGGYSSFTLDVSRMNYQATDQQLLSQGLQSGRQLTYGEAAVIEESRLEDYIVRELINYDDVSYDDHADLIYELAGQAVAHFRSNQPDDAAVHNILGNHGRVIAENIHLQMAKHYEEDPTGSEVIVSQGFMPLKPCAFTAKDDLKPLHWTPDDKRTIGQYVYGGFQRCAFAFQKFHSDTERILATVLEREARRWFRPVSGQFNIYYRSGVNQPEYIPDFVVALDDITLMIETKKAKEVAEAQESETEVKAKADQAVIWCKNASDYAANVGGKPWAYLLIPHDAVAPNMTLTSLRSRFTYIR